MSKWNKGDTSGQRGYRVCYYRTNGDFAVEPKVGRTPLKNLLMANEQVKEIAKDLGNGDICIVCNATLRLVSRKPVNPRRFRNA